MTAIPEVPLSHAQAARELLAQVRKLRESVKDLTLIPVERLKELTNAASVSDEYLETVVRGAEASPELASASKIDSAEVHDVIDFTRAYSPVVGEVELFGRMLRHKIIVVRAKVGEDALRAYSLAKGLNRPRRSGLLVPHIEAMRVALARSRRKTVTKPPEPPEEK